MVDVHPLVNNQMPMPHAEMHCDWSHWVIQLRNYIRQRYESRRPLIPEFKKLMYHVHALQTLLMQEEVERELKMESRLILRAKDTVPNAVETYYYMDNRDDMVIMAYRDGDVVSIFLIDGTVDVWSKDPSQMYWRKQ